MFVQICFQHLEFFGRKDVDILAFPAARKSALCLNDPSFTSHGQDIVGIEQFLCPAVVVVYNGANAMELGFLNEYEQIKGAVWCPGTGQSGFNALGRILSGEVNPSGKTSDTFVADLTATPTWNNFGIMYYDNMDEFAVTQMSATGEEETNLPSFVNYVEGIYVGYKFYETAAAEGLINYDETVVYPLCRRYLCRI